MPSARRKDEIDTGPFTTIPGTNVSTFYEFIGPERARQLLSGNIHNRHLSPTQITNYARDMLNGRWRLGAGIATTDKEQILLDGQHTLHAIIESDTFQYLQHQTGLEPEDQDTMDIGRVRTYGGQLQIRGEKNAVVLGSATRVIWNYENFGSLTSQNTNGSPTRSEIDDTLRRHPGLRLYAAADGPLTGITGSLFSGFKYLASFANIDDAEVFARKLRNGDGLAVGDPILTLRERMFSEMRHTTGRLEIPIRSAFLIRTWNAWRGGEKLSRLQFSKGGANPDRLPLIDGCPILPGGLPVEWPVLAHAE